MSSENRALGRTRALRHHDTFLGLEALIDSEYQDSARAETPLLLCVASRERAMDWVAEHGEASLLVLETVLRTEDDELIPQSAPDGTAIQRVASWILDRHQIEQTTDVPRSVIADLLGMRPETLSRALHSLHQEGLIEVSRRSFMLIDPEGLRRKLPR
jgi:CRP-like cAMP-binding protein